jgi:hypothetical protein
VSAVVVVSAGVVVVDADNVDEEDEVGDHLTLAITNVSGKTPNTI